MLDNAVKCRKDMRLIICILVIIIEDYTRLQTVTCSESSFNVRDETLEEAQHDCTLNPECAAVKSLDCDGKARKYQFCLEGSVLTSNTEKSICVHKRTEGR